MSLFHRDPSPAPASATPSGSGALPARAQWYADQLFRYTGMFGPGLPGLQTTYGKNPSEPIADDFLAYVASGLKGCGPVAAVEGFRCSVLSEARFLFQRLESGRPGDLFWSRDLEMLETPWVGGTTGQLIVKMMLYADFAGSAFVHRAADELVLLRPDWVDVVLTERMILVGGEMKHVGWKRLGYAYWEGGKFSGSKPVIFMPDEVAQFCPLPDPVSWWRGRSWLTPIVAEVKSDKQAGRHKEKFLENAATPNLAVSLKTRSPKAFREFVDAMDEAHKGPQNAGKTLYLGDGADVTVVGKDMKEMDFSSIVGKGETRIANVGGVHPVIVGFSEGMQGSSLNAGNYNSAKRMTVDRTLRPLWRELAGALQLLFPQPAAGGPATPARLWYDPRDVAFLRDDAKDAAEVQATEAQTMRTLIDAGYTPDSVVRALASDDWSLLEHSGLFSVQLQPLGASDVTPTTA